MKNIKQIDMKHSKQLVPEEIIQYCRQKFINILPNTFNKNNNTSNNHVNSQNLTAINIMYKKEEIKQVIRQLSIFLQLVIQNCVLTSDPKIRTQCLKILGNFRNYLSRDLQQFENMLNSRIRGKLPDYEIDCKSFVKRDVVLRIPPQISLYQDPLLFYIYSRVAQEQLFCNHSIMMTREQRIQVLKNHAPFLNPLYLPFIEERLETKAKFTQLEDKLLQIIVHSPQRDISKLKMIYFPNRPEQQIKNRIKNLCGKGKDIVNPIKEMKNNQFLPLKQHQIQTLIVAYNRFGSRWPVISRYYQIRTPQYLQAEYNQCQRLMKKREKEGIAAPYRSFKELLQQKTHKGKSSIEQVQIQAQVSISDEEIDKRQMNESEMESEDREEQPCYKIINNLTFLVEEI